jgi:hypothetical protein
MTTVLTNRTVEYVAVLISRPATQRIISQLEDVTPRPGVRTSMGMLSYYI